MRQRPPGWQRSGKSIAVRRLIRRVFLTVYYGEVAPHWLARRQFQSWLAHSCRTQLLTHKSPNPLQGPYAPQSASKGVKEGSTLRERLVASCHLAQLVSSPGQPWRRSHHTANDSYCCDSTVTRELAGNCNTVARWPLHKFVSRTIFPSGNSRAS